MSEVISLEDRELLAEMSASSKTITSAIFDAPETPAPMVFVEDIYNPTRLDYFAIRALQGLITGRSEKDVRKTVKWAVALAQELVDRLDGVE